MTSRGGWGVYGRMDLEPGLACVRAKYEPCAPRWSRTALAARLACATFASIVLLGSWATPVAAADKPAAGRGGHPDLSGFWNNSGNTPPDKTLSDRLPGNTVVVHDTGAIELPQGDYGGLKVKPKALAEAAKWNPKDDMSLTNACKPPSIVYAMQGPFPLEIYQGTEFIIIKLEYFDMMRVVFMDGRKADANTPFSKLGFSTGRWDGDTLVVETTHLAPATILNNGLSHSDKVRLTERFRLSADGKMLLSTQEFEDPEVLDNRGARFIAWQKKAGDHVYPYDCDPTFALEYQNQK